MKKLLFGLFLVGGLLVGTIGLASVDLPSAGQIIADESTSPPRGG